MATTSSERGLSLRSPGRYLATADRLIALWKDKGSDPRLKDRVLQCYMDAVAYQYHTYQTVTRMMNGGTIGADSSLNKLFWSEMDIATHETALELLGAQAELGSGAGVSSFCHRGRTPRLRPPPQAAAARRRVHPLPASWSSLNVAKASTSFTVRLLPAPLATV